MLKTRSAQLPRVKTDGVRVCIMRRPGEDVDWDIWMPHLAPSHDLLTKYHAGNITWAEFVKIFTKEVLQKQKKYLDMVATLAKSNTITLLCWEDTPQMCHRRLVAEQIAKRHSKLTVRIA